MRFIIIAALVLSSCATPPPLTEKEKQVRIFRKSDPPATCKELGRVRALGIMFFYDETREDEVRRQTAKLGGNAVSVDPLDADNNLNGIAFRCN